MVVSQLVIVGSSGGEEDDGEDGDAACERERVGADEAVLDARRARRSRAGSRAMTSPIEPAISGCSTKRPSTVRDEVGRLVEAAPS